MGEGAGFGGGMEDCELIPVQRDISPSPALILRRARLPSPRRQPALGFQRRHAAEAGRGDGLAVDIVGHVAGGEDARYWSRSKTARS